jgi:hypothetical protein
MGIISLIDTLITGGKYGSSVSGKYSYDYAKSVEKRDKDFAKHGARPCKICSRRIPGNMSHCGSCFFKYVKRY